MRATSTTGDLFANLVTVMNVVGTVSVTDLLGELLEARRQGASTLAAMEFGFTSRIWPIELWLSSIWASRWLLRSGRPNLAALTALLPMLSLLCLKLLQAL